MTDAQRRLCGELIHHCLVEIRNLTFSPPDAGRLRHIHDLADAFEELPRLLYGPDFDPDLCLSILEDLEHKWDSVYSYRVRFQEAFPQASSERLAEEHRRFTQQIENGS